MLCPCGSQKDDNTCCAVFISGQQLPSTPEELMRSRYTAYTQANIDYIADTMRAPAANGFNPAEAKRWAKSVEWLALEVLATAQTDDNKGFVEFAAHFKQENKRQVLHELSEFHRIDDKWFYVDGVNPRTNIPLTVTNVRRNDPCICGSGKKYKTCCGLLVAVQA